MCCPDQALLGKNFIKILKEICIKHLFRTWAQHFECYVRFPLRFLKPFISGQLLTTCIYSLSAWLSLVTFLSFALQFKSPESFRVDVYHSFPSFMRFFHEPEIENILSCSLLKSHNNKSSITAPICPLKFSLIPHRRGISKQEVQAPFLPISQES